MEIVSGQAVTDPSQVRVLIYARGRLVHVPASSLFGTLPQDGDPTAEGQIKWDAAKKAILVGDDPSVFPEYPDSMALGDLIVGTADARQVKRLAKGSALQILRVNAAGTDLEFASGGLTQGTSIATTSGTAHSYTGIPASASEITIKFAGVSLSGTDAILVQIGPSGGVETTGYLSTATFHSGTGNTMTNSTAGFLIPASNAAHVTSGIMTITKLTGNQWVSSFHGKITTTSSASSAGDKTLAGTLDRLTVTRTGTNTFDAGALNVAWQ